MSDVKYSSYQRYGTHAQRVAFTPSPPSAAGVQPIYIWWETDTGDCYVYTTTWNGPINIGSSGLLGTKNGGYSYADLHPASTDPMDDEFDGSSFDTSKWTTYNSESVATFTEGNGILIFNRPFTSSDHMTVIAQPLPATPWDFAVKLTSFNMYNGTAIYAGFCLMNTTSTAIDSLNIATGYDFRHDHWNNLTGSYAGSPSSFAVNYYYSWPFYIRVKSDGTTNTWYWSRDAINWTQMFTTAFNDFITTTNAIGIMVGGKSNVQTSLGIDWFRRLG